MSQQEKSFSTSNSTKEEEQEQLANFFSLLSGNTNTVESENVEDSHSAGIDSQKSDQQNNDDNQDEGINVLQDILVGPHISQLKKKVNTLDKKCTKLETNYQELEEKCSDLEDLVKSHEEVINEITSALSKLLTKKLTDLKQEMLTEIALMMNQFVEDNNQEQKLSIKVVGLRKD